MLELGGLGGDEVTGVGVDVVEAGMVVLVVVGVVRRHFLDARGDAPHLLHVWPRGRLAPRPPPFAPPSPLGSCALPLALGSLPGPYTIVPLSTPWVPPPLSCALACTAGARILPVPVSMPLAAPTLADRALLHSMRSVAACLGALPAPLRVPPVPLSFPCSLPRVVPSAARTLPPSAAAGLGTVPAPSPSLLAVCALPCPLRVSLCTPPVASCPPLRAPVAGTLPRLCAVPPLPDHAPGVLLPPQLRQPDAWRRTLGRRGADVQRPPRGEGGFWGERLQGAGVAVASVGVGAVLRALPATRCGCGGSRLGAQGPRGVRPPRSRHAGGPGRGRGAARRGRGLNSLCTLPASSAAAVAPSKAPGAGAGATPRAGGAPGAAVGAAARLAGAAVLTPCVLGAPSGDGAVGLAAWAAGAVSSAGAGPWVRRPVSAEAAVGRPAGGPTGTTATASRRSSRSSRVSPAHPGETGERKRDRRWWRSSSWGEPLESNITVNLVGMRGGRRALLTTPRCICVVPWAMLCSAPQGGGGEGMGGQRWCSPRGGGGRWPSTGTGAGGG